MVTQSFWMTLPSNIPDNMKLEEYLKHVEEYLRNYLADTKCSGYVLGLSGGVDSSLVAVLSAKAFGKEKVTCLMMPIHSLPEDLTDALKLAKHFDLNYHIIDASDVFDKYTDVAERSAMASILTEPTEPVRSLFFTAP